MKKIYLILLVILFVHSTRAFAQDNPRVIDRILSFPQRFFSDAHKHIQKLDEQLVHQSNKYLRRLAKKEAKMQRRLARVDSAAANRLFADRGSRYQQMLAALRADSGRMGDFHGEYLPHVDSLQGALSFLQQHASMFSQAKELQEKAGNTWQEFKQLQDRFQQSDQIKSLIRERKEQIRQVLGQYTHLPKAITHSFDDFNRQLYYYSEQVREYREMFNNVDALEKKALSLLSQLPAFREFMQQHSILGNLFSLPAAYSSPSSFAGLQTRDQVQQLIQGRIASGGPRAAQALQQNLQAAQTQLDQFKDKLNKLGRGSGDMEMPDFKPNNQRTRSFLKRLEYGTNLQTTRADFYFPTTTDVALSVGYKLNDKSVVGFGMSYKLGWGKDIQHISFSSQGISMRSFLDARLKGSFYASGGFEYNYQRPFNSLAHLYTLNDWQQSGLIGISKIVSVASKFFKKTKVQLLWDFLSYQQIPRTQPIKFRIGYTLN